MSAVLPQALKRFDISGPRYTSFPTADRFVEAFGAVDHGRVLDERRLRAQVSPAPLSLYVHIPFCESLCYYCACNKIITKQHGRSAAYLAYLEREVALYTAHLGKGQPVSQLHLGGGTPTFFSDAELAQFMEMLRRNFDIVAGAEMSIEVDPRTVDNTRLAALAAMGFNRLSFGVQDFDADVQKAVHRVQPAEQVFALVAEARALGFESINVDLIYGLPRQTQTSFARTMRQIEELRPDRIALYAYAHLPERFKPQRHIPITLLPPAGDKAAMLAEAMARLQGAGYQYIGMDHFALAGDALAVAGREGRLHRNFQGYSTQPDRDLLGLGVSAIGAVGASYSQNAKTMEEYCDLLDQGRFPVTRGLALSRDDLARRAVIMAIMCQGQVWFESVELAWMLDFKSYFAAELERLRELEDAGLVVLSGSGFRVTPEGRFLLRAVAMVFDRYLQADLNRSRFSRII